MRAKKYDIEKLLVDDQNEWNKVYNSFKGILKAKAFNTGNRFNEDAFNETLLVVRDKLNTSTTPKDLVNLIHSIYRNQNLTHITKATKFKSKFIHTEDEGMVELNPDLLSSDLSNQNEFEDAEQTNFDLSALKSKIEVIQNKLSKNNIAKRIDLYSFLLDYVTDHEKSLDMLVDEYGLISNRTLRNVVLLIRKEFGVYIKKATKPFDELSTAGKTMRRKNIRL